VIIAFLYTEPTNSQLLVNCYAPPTHLDTTVSSPDSSQSVPR